MESHKDDKPFPHRERKAILPETANQGEVGVDQPIPRLNASPLSPSQIQTLQRTVGNASTIRFLEAKKLFAPARSPGILQRDDVTGSDEDMDELNYDRVVEELVGKESLKYKNIIVQPNGELFIEFRQTNPKSENVSKQQGNSYDEKVHVPANIEDIATRTNIVAQVCMQLGFTSFKTTKPEKLVNVKAGAPMIFETLRDAGLTDEMEFDEAKGIQSYLTQALKPEKNGILEAFFQKKLGKVPPHKESYGFELSLIMDGVVADSGIFPSEQRGREITIYIDPGFKPDDWWKNFALTLVARMESTNLARLPIAKGDQPIRGEGMDVDGAYHAYFSSRDEGMAMDTELGYYGFPTWYGGNSEKSRAPEKPLVFDMDLNEPDLQTEVEPQENEIQVTAHVRRSKWKRFKHWLKKRFQQG